MSPAPRFLQIHFLTSYPATLLNRDDSGLAKRLPFGENTSRTRISSQCLKRHWRKPGETDADIKREPWSLQSIGAPMAVRSREIPERKIKPALADLGTEETREAAIAAITRLLYTPGKKEAPAIKDRQALLIGDVEIAYLIERVRTILADPAADTAGKVDAAIEAWFKKGEQNNLKAMLKDRRGVIEAGLEAALFGRMVTSDPDANTDAAIHVAHAFTVHAEAAEPDYFTVVDDLKSADGESGAGGLFDTELTAGLFYGYVVVDVPLLVSNLGDDAALAGRVVEHLVHLIATVSPGAKKGSTAPYAYADLMLIEAGNTQPRTLANAYRTPCKAFTEAAVGAMGQYLTKIDRAYGNPPARAHLSIDAAEVPGSTLKSMDDLASWARDLVVGQA
ncbi:type I-E CRISPR-associated protein Cas7/Cse4/CasC [Hyphomicrobium sulfonivorans]|uniref:type I-E CRISPR-associated protein Cas7/Cse4/CasC n=1 Tax=Hyphomicrobium sulfonivorans TaxID=121290 RepID=UPI00156DBD26|nr:type I-E CRISPR-associated protein Cas7/Cse4/CasC [Hyphomicrobium sulfonivorans]MBI1650881.1 type I-E CRISPR-associated protein Cas7/Cse4/CasC [Hyphomicrobium sulfonivorans]NSL72737.1 type I-E CRISPR-associated protein Cas7/Cse4/CasC [Hyphomicrobium sulfonivorans]